MELVLFYLFKILAIISAIFVVNARNPVHTVLLLILVFANCAGILLLLEAEFLALVFLVVYIGAIAVLFLFVVMILNIKLVELTTSELNYLPLNAFVLIIVMAQISYLTYSTFLPGGDLNNNIYVNFIDYLDSLSNTQVIGQAMFLFYFFPFILVGFILFVAMIGSILLTLYHQEGVRRQTIYIQNSRFVARSLSVIP